MSDALEGPAIELAVIVLTVAAGSALSALEAALGAFGEVRLLDAAEAGGRDGEVARRILEGREAFSTRLLTGRVMAIVVAVGATVHLASRFERWWVTGLALAGVGLAYTALAVALGAIARARSPSWTLPMARWLRPMTLVASPLAAPLLALARALDRRFPPPAPPGADDDHAVREVELMIEKREESGSLTEEFASLLLGVLEFKDTVARAVMVPRTQMKAVEIHTSIDEVLDLIESVGHSRYPVYRERVDQIEGVLYAKDLFRLLRHGECSEHDSLDAVIRRPPFFTAETQKIGQLLREMQSGRFHLAIVVDEFGGTSGIITLEDILEEIVGEIHDEHDADEEPIRRVGEGHYLVDASVSVYDLGEVLGVELEKEEGDFDSVGGMIVEIAGRVPEEGESIELRGFEFTVRESDERHVTRVEVRAVAGGASPAGEAAE